MAVKRNTKSASVAIARIEALGIVRICELTAAGQTFTDLTKMLSIPAGVLGQWIRSDEVRRQRHDHARRESADYCDSQALAVLQGITKESTTAEITKARELANHRRWQAKVRDPASYGEQTNTKVSVSGNLSDLTDDEITARRAQLAALRLAAEQGQ